MLKLAFSTLPCDGWSAEKIIYYCIQNGFSGIEIRAGEGSIISTSMDETKLEKLAKLFRDFNITVTNIGTSICVKGVSDDEIQRWTDELKKNIFMARKLSASGIRVFLGNFMKKYNSPKEDINYEKIVGFLKNACLLAAKYGIEIWVETHNEFATGKILRKLLNDINMENCKIIWDILHPLEDGEQPEETLEWLGEQCVHIHIKDAIPFEDPEFHDWKYTSIGKGSVPIQKIVKLLLNSGYNGCFSLEWENKWREELNFEWAAPEIVLPHYAEYMKTI